MNTHALLNPTVSILRDLIAFPTVSADSNLGLIDYVQSHLRSLGFAVELFPNEAGTKASLWATLGPADRSGIVLSGHTDVVPAAGQSWRRQPFELTDEGERLYGRGTADMKGYIACVLALAPEWSRAPLSVPIHIALSYDEEVGCLGVRPMLEEIAKRKPLPFGCVIGEPTSGVPVTAHKGKVSFRCDVHGRACHSAYAPQGVNAVEKAARLIVAIEDLARGFAHHGVRDDRFDPPFATAQTGVISGGNSVNVVPSRCSFSFEARSNDEAELDRFIAAVRHYANEQLLQEMRVVAPEANIEFEMLTRYPGLNASLNEHVVSVAREAANADSTGVISFGSEGGLFSAIGIPSVICGPGSMDQGHKPDEFVTRSDLNQCLRFVGNVVARAQSHAPAH